jgi:hypothetical protein
LVIGVLVLESGFFVGRSLEFLLESLNLLLLGRNGRGFVHSDRSRKLTLVIGDVSKRPSLHRPAVSFWVAVHLFDGWISNGVSVPLTNEQGFLTELAGLCQRLLVDLRLIN